MDKKIIDIMDQIGYSNYYDKSHHVPDFTNHGLNCYDEVCPGSHERTIKIRELLSKKLKVDEDFYKKVRVITEEVRRLMKEEHMGISGCSEQEAKQFLDANINFSHFKQYEDQYGNMYLQLDPIVKGD